MFLKRCVFANGNLILGGIPACSEPGSPRGKDRVPDSVPDSRFWPRSVPYSVPDYRFREGGVPDSVPDSRFWPRSVPYSVPDSCSGARSRSSNRPDPNQAWFLGAVGRQTAPWGWGASGDSMRNSWNCETTCGTLETACGDSARNRGDSVRNSL